MATLGIYNSLYGDAPMTFGKALLIAVIGFLLVFLILGVIALFVRLLGTLFKDKNKKSATAPVPQTAVPATAAPPSNRSDGTLTLTNVTEEEAALIMAIVSNNTGVPLSRLRFDSIRLLEDEK